MNEVSKCSFNNGLIKQKDEKNIIDVRKITINMQVTGRKENDLIPLMMHSN